MFKGEYMSMETAQEFALLKRENNLLKEENKRLTKNQRYYKNGVFSLENDKETMSDMIDDYKSRIDKAIEFIKENADYDEDINRCCDDLRDDDCDELLEILKGGKND